MFDLKKVDINNLSQPDPESDLISSNLSESLKIDADKHAKNKQISISTGVPVEAVNDDVERDFNLNKIDVDDITSRSPATAKFLRDIDNTVIAQDDTTGMQMIEETLTGVKEYGSDIAESFEKGQLIVESSELGLSRMYQSLGADEIITDDQIARAKEIDDLLKVGHDDYGFFTGAPIAAAEQLPIMYEILRTGLGYAGTGAAAGGLTGLGVGAVTGPGAIPTAISFAAGGAKIAGRVGVAKAAFDLEAGLAFNEFSTLKDEKDRFLDPQVAGGAAVVVGGVNAALEFMSLAALGRTVTPAMKSVIKGKVKTALGTETGREMITRLIKDYGIAVGTEGVTEALQEFSNVIGGEIAKYIDEDSFTEQDLSTALDNIFSTETADRVIESGTKGAQAALIFAGAGTATTAVIESKQREKISNDEQLKLDTLNAHVAESKLKERDKESFRKFVEEADGDNNTNIFIDGVQVSLYMQDKTAEEIEADPALQILAKQAAEAAAQGNDVQVPVADFAADLAGTEHFDALRDSMTMSEESTSPFRQEQVKQETENYIKNIMEEADVNTSEYVEAQEIFTSVRDQLIDSGRVTPANASIMATVVPAWATAQARRTGKTVQQVYQEAGLTIEGPLTGEAARQAGEQLLSQPVIEENITGTDFNKFITEAAASNKNSPSLDIYTPEEYDNSDLYTFDDGKAGFAISPDGVLLSVFKHPDSNIKGAMDVMIPEAIRHGAKSLDAFEGFLTESYSKFGFVEASRVPWDDKYKLGNDNLDTQHKKLFSLVNRLYALEDYEITK